MRGYSDTQGAAPWSLSGTARGSWVVSSAMYEGIYIYTQRYKLSGCCAMLSKSLVSRWYNGVLG